MDKTIIKINDKEFIAYVAETEEEKEIGLQNVESLEKDNMGRDEGMLFPYDKPQLLTFWMHNCGLDLSIIFIDKTGVVISNKHGIPFSEDYISEDNAQYVFETTFTDMIRPGDKTSLGEDFSDEEDVEDETEYPELEVNKLYIIGPAGYPQGTLEGGERIFSRKSSRVIIRKAKKAYTTQSDADYKSLGRYVFNEIKAQNNRPEEYVEQ